MVDEIKRKQLAQVQFVDSQGNPTSALTNVVSFLTVLNDTTDNITSPIREMGLIGGLTSPNALTATYLDPSAPAAGTLVLINYVTLPPFLLPSGVDMGVKWTLTC
jgi:hypothetical protein